MINKEGFLSKDLDNYEQQIIDEYLPIITYFKKLNSFGQDLSFKLNFKQSKIEHLCLGVLYIRIMSTYQSIYLLNIKGITSEATVLLRTLMELQFIFVSICKDPNIAIEYLGQEAISSRRLFKNATNYPEWINKIASMQEVKEKLKSIEDEIKDKKIKLRHIKYFAEKSDLLEDYETYYVFLCNTSHGNIADLRKHFVSNENGIIESFNWGPSNKEVPKLLLAASDIILNIYEKISGLFSLNNNSEVSKLKEEFNDLHENIKL